MWARRIQNISVAFCRYLQGYFESPQLDICPFNVNLSSLLRKCSARCSPVKKNIRVNTNKQMTLVMNRLNYGSLFVNFIVVCMETYMDWALARRRTPGRNRTKFSNLPVSGFTICAEDKHWPSVANFSTWSLNTWICAKNVPCNSIHDG